MSTGNATSTATVNARSGKLFAQLEVEDPKKKEKAEKENERNAIEKEKDGLICNRGDRVGGRITNARLANYLFELAEEIVSEAKKGKEYKAENAANKAMKFMKSIMDEMAGKVKFKENLKYAKFNDGEIKRLMNQFASYLKGWSTDCLATGFGHPDREEFEERASKMRGVLKPESVDKFVANVQKNLLSMLNKYTPPKK
jgi:uncharacterized protein YfdQ (DUF2303 family)